MEKVIETIRSGYSLSHGLSLHPEIFSKAYIVTVSYGEIYGEIDVTLRRYIDNPEDRAPRCLISQLPT